MNRPLQKIDPPATYQDVLDAPADKVAELVHGALHLHPRPTFRHGIVSSGLGIQVGNPFHFGGGGGPGGWWIIDEPELHLGEHVLVADLAGWRRERMPEPPEGVGVELVPDWVCEILSPSTRKLDLTDKRTIYGEAGVQHLWLIDPDARTLEAFANRDGAWTLLTALKDNDPVSVPPFDAIEFPLAALWGEDTA